MKSSDCGLRLADRLCLTTFGKLLVNACLCNLSVDFAIG